MNDELISTQEAGRRLGVTPRRVVQLVSERRLDPAAKLDGATGSYVFHADDVARLADERRTA